KDKVSLSSVQTDTDIKLSGLIHNFLFSRLPYNIERFWCEKFNNELISILNKNHFDMVLLEGLPLALYIETIRQYFTGKLVMRAHNVEHKIWEGLAKNTSNPVKRYYYSLLASRIKEFESSNLLKYDALIPITEADSNWFKKLGYKGPLFTFPFALDPKEYLPETNPGKIANILFLGALDWSPNIHGLKWFVRKVWPELRNSFPELRLHIAGRNPSRQVQKILSAPGVHFHGEVEDSREYLRLGQIMIVPLFSGSGMRVKILEGMAAGKVILSTSFAVSGIPAENKKHIFVEDTAPCFIHQIGTLINKPHLTEATIINARSFIRENYDIFVLSKKLSHFLNSLNS
ncbi:MAG: glycosyltransferase, partial [Bacteroidota bacterium]|nr:glycosyltransferase [Bacteroidota bacterium]